MSDTLLEQVVEVDVDLDKAVLCESCEKLDAVTEAVWYGYHPCCASDALVCDEHKETFEAQERWIFAKAAPRTPRCTTGGSSAEPTEWRKL